MTEAEIKQALADAAEHLKDGFITRKEYIAKVQKLKEMQK